MVLFHHESVLSGAAQHPLVYLYYSFEFVIGVAEKDAYRSR